MKTFIFLRMLLIAVLMSTLTLTSFAQLIADEGYISLRDQTLYGNNSAALIWNSNHSTATNILLRDKEGVDYGRVYGGGNGVNFGLLDGDGHWSYLAAKDNYTAFKINDSEKMRIKSNGNVGVGTTNPLGKLTVVSSNNQRGLESLNPQGNSHFPWSNGWSYLSGLGIVFRTNGDTERMRIATDGKVGIGTTAPSQKLHVVGAARFSNGSNVGEYIEMYHGGYNAYINAVGDGNIDFRHDNSTKMSINDSGQVLINTYSAPAAYKLGVNGKIICEGMRVRLKDDWADYVFDSDYELMSLEEVETHINANKHLPGIPSAKEVAETGLDIEAMQVKMMEKIEELTLYIIEQDKQIKTQQAQINELMKDK